MGIVTGFGVGVEGIIGVAEENPNKVEGACLRNRLGSIDGLVVLHFIFDAVLE